MLNLNEIYRGDTLETLKTWPSNFVDTIITSPPYWGLRDYGVEGQIGLEPTLDEFLERMLAVTEQLRRVLKPTGVMFWDHGDCYASKPSGLSAQKAEEWGERGDGLYRRLHSQHTQGMMAGTTPKVLGGMVPKCLCLQNYRLILRMIDEQKWILRNTVIWHKPNAMPSSVKDRFSNSYEPVFMLVKKKKYWFDLDAVRVPTIEPYSEKRAKRPETSRRKAIHGSGLPAGNFTYNKLSPAGKNPGDVWETPSERARANLEHFEKKGSGGNYAYGGLDSPEGSHRHPAGKNPGDLWRIPTHPFPEAHFATFPPKLIEPMIKAGCPQWVCKECGKARVRMTEIERPKPIHRYKKKGVYDTGTYKASKTGYLGVHGGSPKVTTVGWTDCGCNKGWKPGIVLDPFMGSGTTALVARKLVRNWIGIELSEDYIKIAQERLKQTHLGI